MKMSQVVEGLRSDVTAVGELGDDAVAEAAERIAAVLDRSVPARVLDLLSDAAAELSVELPDGRVEVRVAGDDIDLAYLSEVPESSPEPNADLSARITLRVSEGLKAKVEESAAAAGLSVNAFVVRTLERGTWQQTKNRGTTRLRGYGRA